MKNIIQALKVVALALILSFGISYVYAWTAPTMTPPNGNVSAPINTSSTAQTKSGGLTVGSITAPSHCIGASCITSWPTGGGVTPPAGSEFLNTSATAQTKAGWLKAVGGNGGDLASRIGVGNNWWMSENTNGNYAIHRNGVGDKLTMDTSGNVVLAGGLTAAGLNTAGTVTASGNIQGQHIKFPGVGGDSGAGADVYSIYQESGPWSYPYPDLRIQYHTGIKYDAYQGYGGHQFYTGWDGTGNPAGLQMQITDKVYVSTDVCTTAGKCLSAATTGASGGTFKTAQDYINAYSGKVATIPAVVAAGHWVNLIGYTWDNVYSSGAYYCNGVTSHCQSYSATQTIKFGSDGYIYADSVPYIDAGYGYWGLYETNGANRVNNIQLCYYATPSLNTTGNGSCTISVATPHYSSGYKLVVGGWLGVEAGSRNVTISYSQNGVTVKGGIYPLTTAMFP